MTDLVVLGTDTDAGKTAFCALWLAAFADHYAYWKPVETGASDTETVRRLVPDAVVHPPGARFIAPVAPPLAARVQGRACPDASLLLAAIPRSAGRSLLIETFGSPLSPLTDSQLQIEFITALHRPTVLVVSSKVGAIGRALQSLAALKQYGIVPVVVVLLGPGDLYAAGEIGKYTPEMAVVSLSPPENWERRSFAIEAGRQKDALKKIAALGSSQATLLAPSPPASGGEGWGEGGPAARESRSLFPMANTPSPLPLSPEAGERGSVLTPSPPASGGEGWGEGGPAARESRSLFPMASTPSPLPLSPEAGERGSLHQPICEQGTVPTPSAPAPGAEGWGDGGELGAGASLSPSSLLAADRECVWHPYTSLRPTSEPLPVVAAEAEFLQLADGRRIIDAISSWWTILHGHRHPPLMTALRQATERIDHVLFAGVTHPDAVRFAELLLKTAPWPGGRVFYSDNGSTAVEVALKMAYQTWCHRGQPQRRLFIGVEHGYHGDTFGAMAVGRDPLFFGRFEPLLFEAAQLPLEANRLDDWLKRRGTETAALIIEPLVQGAGGMRMHTPESLQDLFAVAKRHGLLVIADEVMTANRTGRRWAFQHAGVVPELICAAKTLAGGILPLAATIASPEVVAAFDTDDRTRTFFHGHSFTAHPLACAVAVANEELVSGDLVHERARAIGRFFERELAPMRDWPGVRDVRTCGSIAAVELVEEGGYLAMGGDAIRRHGVERGVLLRPLGNVVYAMPPLGSTEESLGHIVEALRSAVQGWAQTGVMAEHPK